MGRFSAIASHGEQGARSPGRRRTRSSVLAAVRFVVFAAVSNAASAAAQVTPDDALRRDLIAQAEAARDAGDHARAYELATRAAQLHASPSLSLLLAQEAAQAGRIAVALDHAHRCVTDVATVAPRNRERIQRICSDLVRNLDGRIARLTVQVPEELSATSGLVVQAGTQDLPRATWGVPVPVDPGELVVRATLPDGRRFERRLLLAEGDRAEVAVTFASAASAAAVAPIATHDAPHSPSVRSGVGAGPWVVAGLGAVALGTAGVLWALHGNAVSERDAVCDAGGCDPSSIDANNRAIDLARATNASLIVGGVALAAGVTWFVIATARGGRAGDAPVVRPIAWALPGGAGVGVGGSL